MIPTVTTYFVIISECFWHFIWKKNTHTHIYIYILCTWHIFSDILLSIEILAFYLACILTSYLAFYPIWHVFWHPIWHSIRHSIWHSFWHLFRHAIWHLFWHSLWHGHCRTLTERQISVDLIWSSRFRSGSAHWDLELTAEVQQCPLRSGVRCWEEGRKEMEGGGRRK